MKDLFRNMGPLGRLAFFLLFVGAGLLVASIVTSIVLLGTGGVKEAPAAGQLIWIQGISQLLMFLLPALLFAWIFEGRATTFFQTGMKKWQAFPVLLAILLIIIAIPMIDFLTTWNESLHLPESMSQWEASMRAKQVQSQELMSGFLSLPGVGYMLLNLLMLAAIPAICEEFVFRGVIQKTLVGWFRNPHVAIVVTAAVFSLTHFEMFYFVPRFVLGICLGYIYYYTRTIWASVLAHFTNNAIIVVMYYISASNGLGIDPQHLQIPHPALFGAISLILTTIVIFFIAKIGAKNQKNYPD
ncbi:MAG: CPBP family intramembrane metalloprotease [Bacteroidales bacterium]|nr:CPBP family intramembrane metalloprotease [Bacteroidales bacterium]